MRQEQLKARLSDRFRELDIPLMVEWPGAERAALLFVVEHQTQGRTFSVHRLAHYCLDLSELLGLERVVPVVLFADGRAHAEALCLTGDGGEYLKFRFLWVSLAQRRAEDYRASTNIVARVTLPLMAHEPAQRVAVFAWAHEGLATLEPDSDKRFKYADFIDVYAGLDENEWERYRRDFLPKSVAKEQVMGMLAYSRQEGRAEGRQEGRREGAESERRMLLRQVGRRFGEAAAEATAPVLAKLERLEALEELGEVFLDCADDAAWLGRLQAAVAAEAERQAAVGTDEP